MRAGIAVNREAFRYHRENAGLTQQALADASGVTVNYVQKIERGARTRVEAPTLKAFADAMSVTVADLRAAARPSARPSDQSRQVA